MQLKEYAAAVKDVLDAVERGHWPALELLLYALGTGEVEHVHVRPEPAFVHENEAHLGGPRFVGSRTHLLAEELERWRGHCPSEEILILC